MHKIKEEILYRVNISEEDEQTLNLDKVDLMFERLESLEKDLDKYNMQWVYDYAHNEICTTLEHEIKDKFKKLLNQNEGNSIKSETTSLLKKVALSIEKNTKAFNGAQSFITIIEIIFSFIVIMLSHEITSYFVSHYASLVSATIIIAIFALFKIFIEKRYISKINKRRQKRIYKKSLLNTRKAFIQMFIFYIKVSQFEKEHKNDTKEDRHKLALLFIKENHPKLEEI